MRLLLPILIVAFVSGCASLSETPPGDSAAWQARQTALAAISGWDIGGRVAVNADGKAGQAAIHWVRDRAAHRVDLIFPFGSGSLRLTQDEYGAELRDHENRIHRGSSARRLLANTVGWELPIDELNYWVVGLPAPGAIVRSAIDESGRLRALAQGDWEIEFIDYSGVGNYELPSNVSVRRRSATADSPLDVRLSIQRWRVTDGSAK